MIIRYRTGMSIEGILLSQSGNTIRVAARGAEDALEFTKINNIWVSDDCEPVHIEFEWQRSSAQPVSSEAECICPPTLAAQLLAGLKQ